MNFHCDWQVRCWCCMSISRGHAHLWTPAETISLKGVGNFEEGLEGDWRPLEERPSKAKDTITDTLFFNARKKNHLWFLWFKITRKTQPWKDLSIFEGCSLSTCFWWWTPRALQAILRWRPVRKMDILPLSNTSLRTWTAGFYGIFRRHRLLPWIPWLLEDDYMILP